MSRLTQPSPFRKVTGHLNTKIARLLLLAITLAAPALCVAVRAVDHVVAPPPPPASIPPHPRLVFTPARIAAVKLAILSNATDAQLFLSLLMSHGEYVKSQPVVPHGVPGPSGILEAVRQALDYLLTSAAAHIFRSNISDTSYLDRAVLEALNLCVTWPDWNTVQHALDTGEAALSTGLAYDWLYNDLNATTRNMVASGMQSRGLDVMRSYMHNSTVFWDSSWEEGPGYWGYASKYNVWMFAALTSVTGNSSGLAQIPGVSLAARFPIYSTGANVLYGHGDVFNWADAGEGQPWSPFAQWWGLPYSRYNDTAASYFARLGTRIAGPTSVNLPAWGAFVESLAFFDSIGTEEDIMSLPTGKLYDYVNVAVIRGPWNASIHDQNYLSLKGGNSGWNHNHLDLGTFTFDMRGTRYAEDMGSDSYNLPGYFDNNERWHYYRLNSFGHNVVLFGNESQTHPVEAHIVLFNWTGIPAQVGNCTLDGYAVVDLTAAYAPIVTSYKRGFISVSGTAAIVIVDEFTYAAGAAPMNMTWQLHTRSEASQITRTSVGLGGPTGPWVALLGNPGCFGGFIFTNLSTVLPDPPYDSAAGYTRLDLLFSSPAASLHQLQIVVGDASIAMGFQLDYPSVRPIADWATLGPLDFS